MPLHVETGSSILLPGPNPLPRDIATMINDNWSPRQLQILQTTSRVSSGFSLVGALFIIFTFCTSRAFHRPINRLAFFASFGNIATNVATITSRNGILAGRDSALCHSQAMIIQWTIPADALFCFAMALNVYLTVFKKRTTSQLRKLEPFYIAFCYGIPLIPALVFLVYRPANKKPFYGDATLWCWIAPEWNILRVASFYGPVWVILLVTFVIYVMAGRVIFNLRSKLRFFHKAAQLHDRRRRRRASYISRKFSLGSKDTPPSPPPPAPQQQAEFANFPDTPPGCIAVNTTIDNIVQTVSTPKPVLMDKRPDSKAVPNEGMYSCIVTTMNPHPAQQTSSHNAATVRRNTTEANTAAWAYCRCAMLFFLALVITWLPSSINRVHQLRSPEHPSFNLNLAAALVLPAQGFWNGLIYIVTTLPACRRYFAHIGEWMGDTKDRATELIIRPFHHHTPDSRQHKGTGHHGHRDYHEHIEPKTFRYSNYRTSAYVDASNDDEWRTEPDIESMPAGALHPSGGTSLHMMEDDQCALRPIIMASTSSLSPLDRAPEHPSVSSVDTRLTRPSTSRPGSPHSAAAYV